LTISGDERRIDHEKALGRPGRHAARRGSNAAPVGWSVYDGAMLENRRAARRCPVWVVAALLAAGCFGGPAGRGDLDGSAADVQSGISAEAGADGLVATDGVAVADGASVDAAGPASPDSVALDVSPGERSPDGRSTDLLAAADSVAVDRPAAADAGPAADAPPVADVPPPRFDLGGADVPPRFDLGGADVPPRFDLGGADVPPPRFDLGGADVPTAAYSGFVLIPAGAFEMGSPAGQTQAKPAEQPLHSVTITRAFLLADHEVTQREWRELMGNEPSYNRDCGDECPVEAITWYAALAFANAVSDAAGLARCYSLSGCTGAPGSDYACTTAGFAGLDCPGFRLPTEAEWEYAARAGTTTPTQLIDEIADWWICSSGAGGTAYSNPLLTFCRYVCSAGSGPAPVRSLLPNPWGLYDMAGNVREWVWDVYAPYQDGPAVDPLGPDTGPTRVARSSYVSGYGPDCRNARRDQMEPDWVSNGVGFRLARTIR
jgi:formylglycine-generating enzyme required for sulfatase activity